MANKVGITETILRDAHQSLIATRMTTEEMLPIVEKLDNIGYHSLEAWGGATFDACLRFLNETRGFACARLKKEQRKHRFRCCSEVRIFWATVTMRTMWLNILFRNPSQTALIF